jgi:hypothetical protein
MKKLLFALFCLLACVGKAQELDIIVKVDDSRMVTQQTSERAIFRDMEKAMQNFMSNQRWTQDDFRKEERIKCFLTITLQKAPSQNYFEGTAQIKAVRPVYNTTYTTTILSYNDQAFNFGYVQGQPIIYSRNVYTDELSALLCFYAYLILAMDYDSFANKGGEKYVEEAFNIRNMIPNPSGTGWDSRGGNTINRYWIAENLQNQQMIPAREAFYNYHFKGLDQFLKDPEKSRQEVIKVLEAFDGVNKLKPASVYNNIFFDAKGLEIMMMFAPTSPDVRKKVHTLLVRLDPNKAPQYGKLME